MRSPQLCLVPDLPLGLLRRRTNATRIEQLTIVIRAGLVQVNEVVPGSELEGVFSDGVDGVTVGGTYVVGTTTSNVCSDQVEYANEI
jgi:hypothetical protein